MTLLIIGLVIFLGLHSVRIFAEQARTNFIAARGEMAYKVIYSIASLVGLVLIVMGYGAARSAGVPILYDPPGWTRHLAYLLMLPVFVAFAATYFPGRIKTALKHPQLVAVKLWALAHLIANGDLATVVLSVAFLAWAVLDRISVKRRVNAGGPMTAPPSSANDMIALVAGLAIYVGFVIWGHGALIGVPLMG